MNCILVAFGLKGLSPSSSAKEFLPYCADMLKKSYFQIRRIHCQWEFVLFNQIIIS